MRHFFILFAFLLVMPWGSASAAVPSEKTAYKVALVPFKIEGEKSYKDFWAKFKKEVEKAVTAGAELVVFPELLTADLVEAAEKKSPLTEQLKKVALETTPQFMEDVKALSKEKNVAIIGGTTPRMVGKMVRNTAVFTSPTGELLTQDKIFLTPDEKDWGWEAGDKLNVFQTPYGRIAILTCYDAEFPQVSNDLALHNPELVVVPSMTDTIEGFRRVRWTAQARAIEHRAYVLHVGTVGTPDPSWPHWGQPSALSPSEKGFPGLLKEGEVNKSDLLLVDLDMQKLREARQRRGIYPAKDQNERKLKLKLTVN